MSERLRTVCAWCGKVRTGTGEWRRPADVPDAPAEGRATHGICTDCLKRAVPEVAAQQ